VMAMWVEPGGAYEDGEYFLGTVQAVLDGGFYTGACGFTRAHTRVCARARVRACVCVCEGVSVRA
jgi:hypothetical protein